MSYSWPRRPDLWDPEFSPPVMPAPGRGSKWVTARKLGPAAIAAAAFADLMRDDDDEEEAMLREEEER